MRLLLPLFLLLAFTAPSRADFWDEVGTTINGSVSAVGRVTLSPQRMPRTPDQVVQSLSSQISSNTSITPQAANDLLQELKTLDLEKLYTVAADVSTCVIVTCHGLPSAKVASLAERLVASLHDEASLQSDVWTRGLAILSASIALISVLVNLTLGVARHREAKRPSVPGDSPV
ncbi:MAG: hypothetical protein ABI398_09690 [Devosia sp.]